MSSIDTLSYAKRLESAGVPTPQAEAHAAALSDVLLTQAVSQADLTGLGDRLELFVKEQLAQQKAEILKWIFAASLGQIGAVIAVIRYLPH